CTGEAAPNGDRLEASLRYRAQLPSPPSPDPELRIHPTDLRVAGLSARTGLPAVALQAAPLDMGVRAGQSRRVLLRRAKGCAGVCPARGYGGPSGAGTRAPKWLIRLLRIGKPSHKRLARAGRAIAFELCRRTSVCRRELDGASAFLPRQ